MSKGLIRQGIEATVPGAGLASMGINVGKGIGGEMFRHPIRSAVTLSLATAALTYGGGYGYGYLVPEISTETSATVDNMGRAEIIDVDLDIEATPIVAFTAEVVGTEATINTSQVIDAGWLPRIEVGIEKSTLTWTGKIDVPLSYNPDMVEVSYEQNIISDKTDDRLVFRVPVEAFSTTASVQPGDRWDIGEDGRSVFTNMAGAFTDSFQFLKGAPGLGAMANLDRTNEQVGREIAATVALDATERECTSQVISNQTVNEAIHTNIAEDAIKAVLDSGSTEFDNLTVEELKNLKRVVYIGAEDESNPVILTQVVSADGQYEPIVAKIKKEESVTIGGAGKFECKPSDQLVEKLAADSKVAGGTTARAQEETRP
ncbi:hypothetical protein H7Y40_01335 [Pedobacter sp.]|nr:hypothetical protein [Candidatus Saccharibacteria bacterium]